MDGGAWWAAVHGVTKSRTWLIDFHFSFSCIGEGNGSPLQCSCLENPRDGGAWWAAVHGVAQSRTQLMWLSSSSSKKMFWAEGLAYAMSERSVSVLGLFREKEQIWMLLFTGYFFLLFIYLEERGRENEKLALGTEKSHHLPSTSWAPRKSSSIIQSESKGLRTQDLMI